MSDVNPLVVFTPSGKRGRVPSGTSVLNAARQLGVDLDSVCGGRGICSRCQVTPSSGLYPKHGIETDQSSLSKWNSTEERYDRLRGLKKGRRLGCQAQIIGDAVIDVPLESQVHRQIVRKSADNRLVEVDPSVRFYFVKVAESDMHEPSGDWERVQFALQEQWGIAAVDIELVLLPKLQSALRSGDWTLTVAVHRSHENAPPKVIELWPGLYEGTVFGLAVDLGSTTIAMHLCDIRTGAVIASVGQMNPQIRFGEDLMSRVSYAMMNDGGASEMTGAVRETLSSMINNVAGEADINPSLILEAVFVGNPVMHHLLLGIDPVELGQAPFTLATASSVTANARDLDLVSLSETAQVYILPCIAGHVGADAAAVVLSERPHTSKDLVLIVDVGTNAEILLGSSRRVLACSSPTGPAFEGAQISSGQRAAPGAIERVKIDPLTKEPKFKIIGCNLWSDEDGFEDAMLSIGVSGICGSGIIEAVAEMRLNGIIDKSGLIGSAEQTRLPRCVPNGRTNSYVLYEGNGDAGLRVAVTQEDVRAIQLAKSALYAGAKLLMEHYCATNVDRIVLAGAFGSHISPKHAMVLGMIPDCDIDKVFAAGNAAGTGARIALCNISARSEIETTVGKIEKIETAVESRFQEHFVNSTAIPHAVDQFDRLGRIVKFPDVAHNVTFSNAGRRRKRRSPIN